MSEFEFTNRMDEEMSAAKRMGNTELVALIREVVLASLEEQEGS